MARTPENINFCQFVECYYLDGEECTEPKCVFSSKLVKWWEWSRVHGQPIQSSPPGEETRIENAYLEEADEEVIIVT